MEFRNLKLQYKLHKIEINKAAQEVFESGNFIGGDPITELEQNLASYVGVKHCITCANGTDALQLALMAWSVGKGDAVFVPDFTFFSTAEVVPWMGATPIFVDIDQDTFNMSAESLQRAIDIVIKDGKLTPKVVIPVDLFGQPAEHDKIRTIAQKYNMLVLEDGAQGFGGSIEGKMACSFGDIATTSFFPAKPLGCYGDGGAIFTDSDEWADLIRSYKVHGKGTQKYDNIRIGLNSRLDTVQAAILNIKFKIFKEKELDNVNMAAKWYDKHLAGIVKTPTVLEGYRSSWAQYTILLENQEQRDKLQQQLKLQGIPTMIYYPKGLHEQSALRGYYDKRLDYCVTNSCTKRCLSLPMHPYLEKEDEKKIATAILKLLLSFKL